MIFTAICNMKRAISPLHVKDEVDVIGMTPEEECEKEKPGMRILIWGKDSMFGQGIDQVISKNPGLGE
ncbi:MAG: calcium-binding protein [Thermodesulfobacteriota bacterium]|nr:calcium-binding protein [Thermodesulfobacteriota bacterium]